MPAFGDWLRRGGPSCELKTESRAMSATGGVAPDSVYSTLWEAAISASGILSAGATVLNTSDGQTLPLPVAGPHAATSDTATAANAALATSDATIATVNNTVAKYDYLTLVPTELIEDVAFDIESYFARAAGRELGRRIQRQASLAAQSGFTTAGSTGPTGTTVTLGAQGTAGQGTDLLSDLYYSVLPAYRANSAWLMGDTVGDIVTKLKGSNGDVVFDWNQALTPLGRPAYADPFLPVPAANAKTIYFGDWSGLAVRVGGGIRFERSISYGFGNDQVAFRAVVRTGSTVVDAAAVKFFAHSAT
jgi:HK97 family phage major capsid protein